MPTRDPTQAEREYIAKQRVVKLRASYRSGLPNVVVWLVAMLVVAGVAFAIFSVID